MAERSYDAMKIYSRLSALVLAAAMIFTFMMPTASADSVLNVPDGAARLAELGIIQQDIADYSAQISRGDFVTMLMKAANFTPRVTTQFADVDSADSRLGYICAAYNAGVTSGCGNGMFMPDKAITAEEAAKMTVVVLGYRNVFSEDAGLSEYTAAAQKIGLFKGVKTASDGTLTYGSAAEMINNMLDTTKYIVYSADGQYDVNTTDETALEYFFGLTKIYGEAVKIYKSVGRIELKPDNSADTLNLSVSDSVSLEKLFGRQYFYVDMSKNYVVFVDYSSSEVIYDYISAVNSSENGVLYDTGRISKISFKNSGNYRTDKDTVYYLNEERVQNMSLALVNAFCIAFIEDDVVKKLEVYSLCEGGLITHSDAETLKFSDRTWDDNVLNGFDEVEELDIVIDGTPGYSMTDIKLYNVFDYYSSGEHVILVVSTRKAEGVFKSYGTNTVTIGSDKLDTSGTYGVLTWSSYYARYVSDEGYDNVISKNVTAYIDDNKEVRFIRSMPAEGVQDKKFAGLVTGGDEKGLDGKRMGVIKVTSAETEEEIYKVKDKLADGSVSFEYAAATAKALDGSNFFEFTVNGKNEITKIESVKYFGRTQVQQYGFPGDKQAVFEVYIGDSIIFAPVFIGGKYTVKTFKYSQIVNWGSDSGVTLISDYDTLENPCPKYVMLGKGFEEMHELSRRYGIITDISSTEDKTVITMANGDTYDVTDEYVKSEGLKTGMYIIYYKGYYAKKDSIQVVSKRDLSGSPDTWTNDNATYAPNAGEGFFRADDIVVRNGSAVQFIVNGEKTRPYLTYDYTVLRSPVVFEYKNGEFKSAERKHTGMSIYARNYYTSVLTAIQRGDDIWFQIDSGYHLRAVVFQSNSDIRQKLTTDR